MTRQRGRGTRRRVVERAANAALLLLLAVTAAAEVNRIVLRVNDRIATLRDYERRLGERVVAVRRAENLDAAERQQRLATAGEDTLRDLFEELLILSRADQLGILPTEAEVEEAMLRMRESLGIATEEQFQAALAQSGMTLADLREQTRRNLLMRGVMGREVQPRVEIKEEDLRRYYLDHPDEFRMAEQVRLREAVVLEESGLSADEMLRAADAIRREFAAGKTLEEAVAAQPRPEVATVVELGWVGPGDLDSNLASAISDLEPGELSVPAAGRGGLHLVEVLDRTPSQLRSYDEVVAEIQARERDRLFQQELQEYLDELREKSYIVAEPPPGAAGFLASTGVARPSDTLQEISSEVAAPPPAEELVKPAPDEPAPDEPPSESAEPPLL